GNLWFTSAVESLIDTIGRMTPAGVIDEYSPSAQDAGVFGRPRVIRAGSDGNLWFTEGTTDYISAAIGRITPSGTISEFPVAGAGGIAALTAGRDGNIWFTDNYPNRLGRITPAGNTREFDITIDDGGGIGPRLIVTGSACDLWFVDSTKIVRVTL